MWTACLLLALAVSPTGDLIPEGNGTDVEIVALYPNPVHPGNDGEFVVVHLPEPQNLSGWQLRDDGRQRAKPPPVTVEGTVAFSHHPDLVADYLDVPVYELDGWLQLAVRGETLTLVVDGEAVDTVGYDTTAPQAHLWVRDRDDPWVPLAATAFEPVTDVVDATAFVLPDSPDAVAAVLATATDRLYLGGYELGDPTVTDALIDAAAAGVDVAVHAEGRPVGGMTTAYAHALDRLDDAGVAVTVHRGPYARYGYHHPKYVVIDDRVLVTTENFKPAGTGGGASRGWAAIVDSAPIADAAAAVFAADRGWRDAQAWAEVRDAVNRHEVAQADGDYPAVHTPTDLAAVEATLLVAPDNAEDRLVDLIDGASNELYIKQVRISDAEFPLMAAALDRARDGVAVRVLLADRWYVREENEALAAELHALADAEGLDLEVALVDDTETFDRIHAKGLIVDRSVVMVGSINWNNHSLRQNRELAVVLEDPAVAGYFIEVFEADWPPQGGHTWELPALLVLATLAAGGLVAEHARRLRMEGPAAQDTETVTEGEG